MAIPQVNLCTLSLRNSPSLISEHLHELIYENKVIHADEKPVKVMRIDNITGIHKCLHKTIIRVVLQISRNYACILFHLLLFRRSRCLLYDGYADIRILFIFYKILYYHGFSLFTRDYAASVCWHAEYLLSCRN